MHPAKRLIIFSGMVLIANALSITLVCLHYYSSIEIAFALILQNTIFSHVLISDTKRIINQIRYDIETGKLIKIEACPQCLKTMVRTGTTKNGRKIFTCDKCRTTEWR